MSYAHGDWYCKPANEQEAKEIIERAMASGAELYDAIGASRSCEYEWNNFQAWGVLRGKTRTDGSGIGDIFRYSTEYTIAQVREKFPLPGEKKTEWNGEGLPPAGWHGECSSDKHGWFECILLPDGFIALTTGDKLWQVDNCDGLALQFRPLRTERERWVEQALNVLQKDPCAMPSQLMGIIYDAIKSGTMKAPEVE